MDIALLSGASVLSLSAFAYFKSQLQTLYGKQKMYLETPTMTPSMLLNSLKNVKGDEVRTKVFLHGVLTSEHPFYSKVANVPLILSQYCIDNIYSNERYSLNVLCRRFYSPKEHVTAQAQKPQYQESNGAPVFQISDYEGHSRVACKVTRNINVSAHDALEFVGHREHLRRLNPFDKVMLFIGMVLKLILRLKINSKGFRGFKVGVQEIEYGVQLNQILLVFGEVVADVKRGTLRMDKPIHILKDKSALLLHTAQRIRSKSIHLLLTTVVCSFFITWAVKRSVIRYKQYLARSHEERLDKLRGVKELIVEGMECIICCQRPRSVILKPCKHLSMCKQCFNQLQKNKGCPICKQPIQDFAEIFIA